MLLSRRIHMPAIGLSVVCCFGIALALTLPSAALAQMLYGTLVGNIRDSTGAVIPGATVTATNIGTNETREAIATDAGTYTFTNLQPGTYRLRIAIQGFKEYVRPAVEVTVNNVARVDVTMEVGAPT